ncbi:MAG: response regulator transcription factor [Burkholderiales bacterium]|jgi:DNA-binding response OmpR family regulator|nr:response regulator transcription factor [Burkholderiales bacterium]
MNQNPSTSGVALVVEDDDQIAYLLRFILEREGYRVELAADGRAAQVLIGSMQPPALAMLDVMLPHVDGYQLLGMIRALKTWQAVPVLMLTAKSQEKDIVRALDAGASDYLVKPFKPDELRARIKRMVRGRK